MFCPSCGLEDKQSNQFCRACGADLRPVRGALEKPDSITSSAVSARDEIGRAVAAKIREMNSARDLTKVAEDVLPQIEKFLESPEEKRLRRIRTGVIVASVGIGIAAMFAIVGIFLGLPGIIAASSGLIVFFVGLGIFLNGMFLTVPPKTVADNSLEAQHQREMDKMGLEMAANAGWLNSPSQNAAINQFEMRRQRKPDKIVNSSEPQTSEDRLAKDNVPPFSSVTEQTTQHLEKKKPVSRD